MKYLLVYLLIVNAAGLALMLADKQKARQKVWRIPEPTLLSVAAAGGSLGIWMGMYCFRHKTRHPKFFLGVPVMIAIQGILIYLLLTK